jgi:hypothetical protein
MNRTDHADPADLRPRFHGDRGEGVISTAIAVLIVAFIGAAMWVAFNSIWTDAEGNIQREVGNIGASPAP